MARQKATPLVLLSWPQLLGSPASSALPVLILTPMLTTGPGPQLTVAGSRPTCGFPSAFLKFCVSRLTGNKSYCWAVQRADRIWLQKDGQLMFPTEEAVPCVTVATDLGAVYNYDRCAHASQRDARLPDALARLDRLRDQPRPVAEKASMVQRGIWPSVLYGCESHCHPKALFQTLRSRALYCHPRQQQSRVPFPCAGRTHVSGHGTHRPMPCSSSFSPSEGPFWLTRTQQCLLSRWPRSPPNRNAAVAPPPLSRSACHASASPCQLMPVLKDLTIPGCIWTDAAESPSET